MKRLVRLLIAILMTGAFLLTTNVADAAKPKKDMTKFDKVPYFKTSENLGHQFKKKYTWEITKIEAHETRDLYTGKRSVYEIDVPGGGKTTTVEKPKTEEPKEEKAKEEGEDEEGEWDDEEGEWDDEEGEWDDEEGEWDDEEGEWDDEEGEWEGEDEEEGEWEDEE